MERKDNFRTNEHKLLEVMTSSNKILDPNIINCIMKTLDDRPVNVIDKFDPENNKYSLKKFEQMF